MDLVMIAPCFPNPGETVLGGTFAEYPGGKGANQAVAAARMGAETSFVGAVGCDGYGNVILSALETAKVDVSQVAKIAEERTGIGLITVDQEGQNTIVVASGANAKVSGDAVRKALREVQPNDIVLAQLETSDDAVVAASGHGVFLLNPAPASSLPEAAIAKAFAVTPNQHEALAFAGIWPTDNATCELAAAWFLDRGAKNVVITLGSEGATWVSPDGTRHYPALDVVAVDATAAGDSFSGSLACFLSETGDLGSSIELANRAAGISVTRHGAIPSLPFRSEVQL